MTLPTVSTWLSVMLAKYTGEDPYSSMAESGGAGSLCLTGMAASTGTTTKREFCWLFSGLGLTAGFWREAARLSAGGLWGGEVGRKAAWVMICGMDEAVGVYMWFCEINFDMLGNIILNMYCINSLFV